MAPQIYVVAMTHRLGTAALNHITRCNMVICSLTADIYTCNIYQRDVGKMIEVFRVFAKFLKIKA